jgi:hypothetical protein
LFNIYISFGLCTRQQIVDGYLQKDGLKLKYVLNGAACLATTAVSYTLLVWYGWFDTRVVVGDATGIVTALQLFSYAISALILLRSRVFNLGKLNDSIITDFFFGQVSFIYIYVS